MSLSIMVSSMNNLGNPQFHGAGWYGFRFDLQQSITVKELGRYRWWSGLPRNMGTHTVKLLTATGDALPNGYGVTSINMSSGDGFLYAALSPFVTLFSGTSYLLVSEEWDGEGFYDFDDTVPVIASSLATGIVPASIVNGNLTIHQGAGESFGPLNLKYSPY